MNLNWEKAEEYIKDRVEDLRSQLEADLNEVEAAKVRGAIAAYRGLLALPDYLTGQAELDDREESPPSEEGYLHGR